MDRPNRLQSSKSATGASGTLQDDAGEKDLEQGLIRLSNHWVIAVSGRRASFARITEKLLQNTMKRSPVTMKMCLLSARSQRC